MPDAVWGRLSRVAIASAPAEVAASAYRGLGTMWGRLGLAPRQMLVGAGLFLVIAPLLAVLQQAVLLGAAGLLHLLTGWFETTILPGLPVDPVYGGAGLRVLGGISPRGLAIAGEVGRALHRLMPSVFGPARAVGPDVFVSALLAPGATISARAISAILATAALIVVVRAIRRRSVRSWAGPLSVLIRVYLLLDLARECAFSVRELEATGLPFALAALSPVNAEGQRELATRQLDRLPDGVVGFVCALSAVLVCVGIVRLVENGARLTRVVVRRRWRQPNLPRPRLRLGPVLATAGLGLARVSAATMVVTMTVVSPLSQVADGQPAVTYIAGVNESSEAVSDAEPADPSRTGGADDTSGPFADTSTATSDPLLTATSTGTADNTLVAQASASSLTAAARGGPTSGVGPPRAAAGGSVVTLDGRGYHYTLWVDGNPFVVKGMGYNPWYASLPIEERKARYDRDFAAMQEIGVNTLEGWFQDQFDEVTLEAAQRHGIKVIMPFELNQDYDYSDPAVQDRFRREVRDWVLRYRDNPAVLMWGPGNEVMHRLIFPTAVQGKQDSAQDARADAYGAFYVELMDMVHDLDPNHPVIYRDAEDLYFGRFRTALQRDGVPRPWFIYGMNVYTQRLAADINNWPNQGVDAPLLISEFSPGGVGPNDRPGMFAWYWSTIRAHPNMVLGGVVYTWATQGPEDLDRVFGLTDADGKPVDGSVEALGRLFRP